MTINEYGDVEFDYFRKEAEEMEHKVCMEIELHYPHQRPTLCYQLDKCFKYILERTL